MPLENLHHQFAAGLTDPDMPVPEGVVDPQGKPAPKRFAVYRNNVTVSLIENLKAAYPSILALVGDEMFSHLAREFLRANPPRSPVMLHYGKGFGPFLGKMNQLARHPFLPDVARLEHLWLKSYHAADADPLTAEALNGLSDRQWAQARFKVHPAAFLLDSDFPIVDLFEAGRNGPSRPIDKGLAQWALVTRPQYQVQVLPVTRVSGAFLRDIMDDMPIGVAAANRVSDQNFDLGRVMGRALQAGLFARIILEGDDEISG